MATSVDPAHADTVAEINREHAAEKSEMKSQSAAVAAPPAPAAEPLPKFLEDFDDLIKEDVKPFVAVSEKIGDLVETQVDSCVHLQEKHRD